MAVWKGTKKAPEHQQVETACDGGSPPAEQSGPKKPTGRKDQPKSWERECWFAFHSRRLLVSSVVGSKGKQHVCSPGSPGQAAAFRWWVLTPQHHPSHPKAQELCQYCFFTPCTLLPAGSFYLGKHGKSSRTLPLYIWGMKKWGRDQYPVLGLQVRGTELPLVSTITLAKGKGALGRTRQRFAGSSWAQEVITAFAWPGLTWMMISKDTSSIAEWFIHGDLHTHQMEIISSLTPYRQYHYIYKPGR